MAATCNRERMTALAEALESGEYRQAKYYLRVTGGAGVTGYCCAGVAGVLAAADGVGAYDENGVFRDAGSDAAADPYAEDSATDPEATFASRQVMTTGICKWLGLVPGEVGGLAPYEVRNLPVLVPDGDGVRAELGTTLNDNGEDFAYIAARVRETYLTDDAPAEG